MMATRTAVIFATALIVGAVVAAQQPVRDNPAQPSKGTAVIAGTVTTDERSPQPARRVRVTLNSVDRSVQGRTATTDDAGRFEFRDVPAGRFTACGHQARISDGELRREEAGAGRHANPDRRRTTRGRVHEDGAGRRHHWHRSRSERPADARRQCERPALRILVADRRTNLVDVQQRQQRANRRSRGLSRVGVAAGRLPRHGRAAVERTGWPARASRQ